MSEEHRSEEDQPKKEYEKIPSFVGEMGEWLVDALALYGSPTVVAKVFLEAYPEYDDEDKYGPREVVIEKLRQRFKHYTGDTSRKKYHQIKERAELLKSGFLDTIPYANAIKRIAEFTRMLYEEELTPMQKVSIINKIGKIADSIHDFQAPTASQNEVPWQGANAEFPNPEEDKFRLAKQQRD